MTKQEFQFAKRLSGAKREVLAQRLAQFTEAQMALLKEMAAEEAARAPDAGFTVFGERCILWATMSGRTLSDADLKRLRADRRNKWIRS